LSLKELIEAEDDIGAIRAKGHKIRGAVANIGAEVMQDIAHRIELAEDFKTAKDLFHKLFVAYGVLKDTVLRDTEL